MRSDENLSKINSDLYEIKGILDKSLTHMLEREVKLEDIRNQASFLKTNSEKMLEEAEKTKKRLRMRKYLFFVFLAFVFILIVGWKLFL